MSNPFKRSFWALSRTDVILLLGSVAAIVLSFFAFGGGSYLTLAASLIGVTSLIFNAKGKPIGQVLMIVFSLLYGVISLSFAYYGEMITYLGMTAPMAAVSLISWIRHPYGSRGSEVRVNELRGAEWFLLAGLTAVVTFAFYFILRAFNTANLFPSTVSVATSFLAAYLTLRRSEYFTLAYAANDVVLIVLWSLATASDRSYASVVICFAIFLVNDVYGFVSWRRMKKRQRDVKEEAKSALH